MPIPREHKNIANHVYHAMKSDIQRDVHCVRWSLHWTDIWVGISQNMFNQMLLAFSA